MKKKGAKMYRSRKTKARAAEKTISYRIGERYEKRKGKVVMPKCCDKRKTCFAYCRGACGCLSDTKFGNRKCPFFKPRHEYDPDKVEAEIMLYGYAYGGGR